MALVSVFLIVTLPALAQPQPLPQDQAQPQDNINWQEWYGNFQNNSFIIELGFDRESAETLKQRLNIYRLRLIYIPAQSAGSVAPLSLRIGFFRSRAQAQEFLDASDFLFRRQTVRRVTAEEHQQVIDSLANPDAALAEGYFVFPVSKDPGAGIQDNSKKILQSAKTLYMDGNYRQALSYYQLLSIVADDDIAAWSQELIGLCYEKLGDYKQAEQAYETRLAQYPEAEGVRRVEQRLRGVQTAAEDGHKGLRKTKYQYGNASPTFFRGDVGQYHRSLTRSIGGGDSDEVMSVLSTDFDFRGSSAWKGQVLRGRINGFWIKDQLDSSESEFRLRRAYVDYQHDGTGVKAALGRQKEFDSGVFTSFDGATVSYPVLGNVDVSVSAGKPVYFSDIYDDLDYFFYSVYADWQISQSWSLNTYVIEQTLNDVTDREAVGVRGQYASSRVNGSLNLDYDSAFGELNNILLNINYLWTENLSVTGMYGKQRSPFLSAANILIGQADLDLELYLQSRSNVDSLLEDALERTSLNSYYSLSMNYDFSDKGKIIVDYYQSDLTDIPTAEILTGVPSLQPEITTYSHTSMGAQLIINNAFFPNDSSSLGLRSSDGTSSSSISLFLNNRIRVGNFLVVNPKINYSQTSYEAQREDQHQLRYALSLAYKPFRNTELSLEWGNESITVPQGGQDFDSSYVFFGYRVHF